MLATFNETFQIATRTHADAAGPAAQAHEPGRGARLAYRLIAAIAALWS